MAASSLVGICMYGLHDRWASVKIASSNQNIARERLTQKSWSLFGCLVT